jgi:hypothetical protein
LANEAAKVFTRRGHVWTHRFKKVVLAVGQHDTPDRYLVHLPDGLADDGEGVVSYLAVRKQIVGADQVARIDLAAVDEFVDFDGPGRFQRHVLEFVLRHLDEGIGVDLVALDDVLVGTSSPVSASTLAYLMRWPVFRLS